MSKQKIRYVFSSVVKKMFQNKNHSYISLYMSLFYEILDLEYFSETYKLLSLLHTFCDMLYLSYQNQRLVM